MPKLESLAGTTVIHVVNEIRKLIWRNSITSSGSVGSSNKVGFGRKIRWITFQTSRDLQEASAFSINNLRADSISHLSLFLTDL